MMVQLHYLSNIGDFNISSRDVPKPCEKTEIMKHIIITLGLLLISLTNVRAFTIMDYVPLSETPLVIITASEYANIGNLTYHAKMYKVDSNGNMEGLVFYLGNLSLTDTNYFSELGSVYLSGETYYVFSFIYDNYSIGSGYIGMFTFSNTDYVNYVRSCNERAGIDYNHSRWNILMIYNLRLRSLVNYQPYSALSSVDQQAIAQLLGWYIGLGGNAVSINDCSDLLDPSFLGNSMLPVMMESNQTPHCSCNEDVYEGLLSLASAITNESISFEEARLTLARYKYDCNCLSDYIIIPQSDDEDENRVYLLPLKSNRPAWILHIRDTAFQIVYSYQFSGGINGLIQGSEFSNGLFGCNNGFSVYKPLSATISCSDPDFSISQGDSVLLFADTGFQYLWSTGDTCSSIAVAPSVSTTFSITVTELINGCSEIDSVTITVCPYKYHIAGPDKSTDSSGTVIIGTAPMSDFSYEWLPVTGLSDPSVSMPAVHLNETLEYSLTATSTDGCIITDKVIVEVLQPGIRNLAPIEYRADGIYSIVLLIKLQNDQVIPVSNPDQKSVGVSCISDQYANLRDVLISFIGEIGENPDSVFFLRSPLDANVTNDTLSNIFTVLFPAMMNVSRIKDTLLQIDGVEKVNLPFRIELAIDGVEYFDYEYGSLNKPWHIEQMQAPNAWIFIDDILPATQYNVGVIDMGIIEDYNFELAGRINFGGEACTLNLGPTPYQHDHSNAVASVLASNPADLGNLTASTISVGYRIPTISSHDFMHYGTVYGSTPIPDDAFKPFDEFASLPYSDGIPNDFLNLSWTLPKPSQSQNSFFASYHDNQILNDLILSWVNSGITVVAAVGNHDKNPGIGYPFGIPGVIGVGGTSVFPNFPGLIGEFGMGAPFDINPATGNIDCYNYNKIDDNILSSEIEFWHQAEGWLDITAPAHLVSVFGEGNYTIADGTSLAAPAVAAVLVSMRAINPDLGPLELRNILFETCDKVHYHPGGMGMGTSGYSDPEYSSIFDGYSYKNRGFDYQFQFPEGFYDDQLDHVMGKGRVNALSAIMNSAALLEPGGFLVSSNLNNHKVTITNVNDHFLTLRNHTSGSFPASNIYRQEYEYDAVLNQPGANITFSGEQSSLILSSNSTFRISNTDPQQEEVVMTFQDLAELTFENGNNNANGLEFTKLVVEAGGVLNLFDKEFYIPDKCILEIDNAGTLNIGNAHLVIEPGGVLLIRPDANLNLFDQSIISSLCYSYVSIEHNANLDIGPASKLDIYRDAYTYLNDGPLYYDHLNNPLPEYIYTYIGPTNSQNAPHISHTGTGTIQHNVQLDAGFSYTPLNGSCMGTPHNFSAQAFPMTQYTWDFGDGTVVSGFSQDMVSGIANTGGSVLNPWHIYTSPGVYRVSLKLHSTAEPSCGDDCLTDYISVIPSLAGYNDNCCSETQINYQDIGIAGMIYDPHTGSYDIYPSLPTQPVVINGGHYQIRGTVFLHEYAGLSISNNTIIEFGPNARIIVSPKATLTLGQCTLQGLTTCGTMWQGIEVWGKANSAFAADQGVIVIDNARIRDAHNAIVLGRTRTGRRGDCLPQVRGYNLNFSGGYIAGSGGANLENNGAGIRIMPYKYYNHSQIYGFNITGGALKDPGYYSGNPHYTYSGGLGSPHNNFYAAANPQQRGVFGIWMWKVRFSYNMNNPASFRIDDNEFSALVSCVESFDSRFSITNCYMDHSQFGIRIFNTASSINNGHYIYNNKIDNFESVLSTNPVGIWLEGGKYGDKIYQNFIGMEQDPWEPQEKKIGIYTMNSYNFRITDNTITHLETGIKCANQMNGSGLIGYAHRGNVINGCRYSIETLGENQKLIIKCNDFNFNNLGITSWSGEYGLSWKNSGKLGDQGSDIIPGFPPGENEKFPAGNKFDENATIPMKIISNDLLIPYWYDYYHHTGNPYLVPVRSSILDAIGIIPVNTPMTDKPTACTPVVINWVGVPVEIKSMQTRTDSLKDVYEARMNALDYGHTQILLDAIQSNSSGGQLAQLLLNHSPLSDTVLTSVIVSDRKKPLSPGNFRNILLANSPVSDPVRIVLEQKLPGLPPGIVSQIRDAQAGAGFATLTSINRMISQQESRYEFLLGEYIPYLLEQDSLSVALALLDEQDCVTSDQGILATLLSEGFLQDAAGRIVQMQEYPELETWLDLTALLLEFETDSMTVFEMDSAQEQMVRTCSQESDIPLLASNAQAVLRLVYGEEFPVIVPGEGERSAHTLFQEELPARADSGFLGNNFPNPFSGKTVIPYYMPEQVTDGRISIYDASGKLISQYVLVSGNHLLEIEMGTFGSGLYICNISFDGIVRQYKKMLYIRNQ